ncbi:uncharacterized membrane protein (UPF0127 family) [Methylobacterium sp. PvP062]|uniref:Uncharacterized membrane protein (UPF0127 family) n=1 Tax=Methylobacterium radiotolerans TaxID=31998 RepID=A0ABV2NMK6_9HYPH|nr:uncharacterized membrane protein (UPF0127 family) [Methylobacterium sp. PvP105]MBP2504596.1 uncharacterized membrane protein (UPF0127 family) [Methylobacterium sp. PvP109]
MRSLFRTARAAAIACLALTAIAPAPAAVAQAAARAATARSEPLTIVTKAGPKRFDVEVMRDDAARARGLMFRRHMAADHGMLFDFEQDQPVTMWMKNTYLPLDMVFIRPDGTISRIAADTEPLSTAIISSGGPVLAVLELNAGTAAKLGIAPGDRIEHAMFKTR